MSDQITKIEVLEYTDIVKIMDNGSSYPLLITALNGNDDEIPYVMKTYKTLNVEQNFTIAKDILISELAKEFDLKTPEYGIIDINNQELSDIYNDIELSIDEINEGYKFCTKLEEGAITTNSDIMSKRKLEQYHIENIFAFDNLIMNSDRGGFRGKPNLLINDEDILLIDHEQTLPFINNFDNNQNNFFSTFTPFDCSRHIFYNELKKTSNKDKIYLFNEFCENLRVLNVQKFVSLFKIFDKFNIIYGDKDRIFAYLNWAKKNYNWINELLIKRVS